MPRIARVVVPGCPHHIIQRGNRQQRVFFSKNDKFIYLKLLEEQAKKYGLEFWAYCLMDNHVHLIAIPHYKESFMAVAETNRRYTLIVNLREGWRGYLWQGRFISFPMDESYCYEAMKYVENNPVRANIVKWAEEYPFSSAKFHIYGRTDKLISRCPLQDQIKDWKSYLRQETKDIEKFRQHQKTGRPLGSEEFVGKIEDALGRVLRRQKPGPKSKILN